jgi:hypothetical protein
MLVVVEDAKVPSCILLTCLRNCLGWIVWDSVIIQLDPLSHPSMMHWAAFIGLPDEPFSAWTFCKSYILSAGKDFIPSYQPIYRNFTRLILVNIFLN